jgi:hypothetical protein
MSVIRGENVVPAAAPAASWWAWAYLVTFGSVVAFTAYVWVLGAAPISFVATYAYVNPVVAVFLGWLILSEPITLPIIAGGGVVVAAVAIVVAAERPGRAGRAERAAPPGPHQDPTTNTPEHAERRIVMPPPAPRSDSQHARPR